MRLWTLAGDRVQKFPDGQSVNSVAFHLAGTMLAASYADGKVRLWNLLTRTRVHTLNTDTFLDEQPVVFRPDGDTLATKSEKRVQLWDTTTGNLCRILADGKDRISAVAFNLSVSMVATNSFYKDDGRVSLWDMHSGQSIRLLAVE